MQKEYEVKWINTFTQSKDGKQYLDKYGRPFCRVSLKVAEHGEEYIGGFWNGAQCPWQVGDKIKIEIYKEMYQGKEQLKFRLPPKETAHSKDFEEIKNSLTTLKMLVSELVSWKRLQTGEDKPKIAGTDVDYPTPESEGIAGGPKF